jgi:hypothetical protein
MSKRDTDSNGTLVVTYRDDEGEVNKRRLAGILGAATTAMMAMLIVVFSLGMVGAAVGVGIGGFVADFGQVNATDTDGATIYPVLAEQPACESAPQLNADINGEVQIGEYVEFRKDLPLPSSAFTNGQIARITIVSDVDPIGPGNNTISADNLDLRLTALKPISSN